MAQNFQFSPNIPQYKPQQEIPQQVIPQEEIPHQAEVPVAPRPDINALINFATLSTKVPEDIRTLPEYSGDRLTLAEFINSVETIRRMMQNIFNDNPIYINAIRAKIVGKANEVLVSNYVPNQWDRIKEKLIEYFANQKDIQTIVANMRLSMRNKTLSQYYTEANQLSADISSCIAMDPENMGHEAAIMRIINKIILGSYIDGLPNGYRNLVMVRNPRNLVEANNFAKEWESTLIRQQIYSNQSNYNVNKNYTKKPQQRQNNSQSSKPNYQSSRNYTTNSRNLQSNSQTFTPNPQN